MPALLLIRGWSIAILLSFFVGLSCAQVFTGFPANPNVPAPAVYTQASVQTFYYTSYSAASQGTPASSISSNGFTSVATETVSSAPNGTFTSGAFFGTGIVVYTAVYTVVATTYSPVSGSAAYTFTPGAPASNADTSGIAPSFGTGVYTEYSTFVQTFSTSAPAVFTTQVAASFSQIAASATSTSLSPSNTETSRTGTSIAATFTSATFSIAASSTAPLPETVGGFDLIGCVGSASGYQGFQLSEQSTAMSIDRCVSDCKAFAYAGIFDTLCYCGNTNVSSRVTTLAQGSCKQPCPGNPSEICGGRIRRVMRFVKRQASLTDVLLTLYANPAIVNGSATSTSVPPTPSLSLPTSSGLPSGTAGPNSTSTTLPPQANPTTASSLTTVLATAYIDICPTGYTTITTTLTTTHCGCTLPGSTAIHTPIIPMTTMEKICSVCAEVGDNSPKTVTLTLPDTSAIASSSATAIISANAVAPVGSSMASPGAPATGGAAPQGQAHGQVTPPSMIAIPGTGSPGAGGSSAAPPSPSSSSPPSQPSAAPSQPLSSPPSSSQPSTDSTHTAGPAFNKAGPTDARRVTLVSVPTASPLYTGAAAAAFGMPLRTWLGVLVGAVSVALVMG